LGLEWGVLGAAPPKGGTTNLTQIFATKHIGHAKKMSETTLYTSFLIATIVQSTLLAGMLLTNKKSDRTANYILCAY